MSKVNSSPFGMAVVNLLVVLILASCNGFTISDLWTVRCSEMPSLDEVQEIMDEYDDFFEEMQEEGLIWDTSMVRRGDCQERAFIIICHGGEWQKPLVLEMMDDLGARSRGDKYFFDVPFRFLNVKKDDFYGEPQSLDQEREEQGASRRMRSVLTGTGGLLLSGASIAGSGPIRKSLDSRRGPGCQQLPFPGHDQVGMNIMFTR